LVELQQILAPGRPALGGQIISYEIPLTLSVVGVIILAGTMSMNRIVLAQSGSLLDWFVFKQPLAALIFFIAARRSEPNSVRHDRGRL